MLTSVCALASMTLVGCAEEVADLLGANATKVEVTASVGAPQRSALTRGADGLDGSTGFSLIWSSSTPNIESKVKVWADNGAGSFSDYSYKVTGAKAIEAESSTPTFPAGVTSVSVYGWYPYTANNTFTIKNNQQSDADYCLSDLMLAQPANCTRVLSTGAVTPAALNFEHVMSKVKVVVSPVGDVTVTGVSLNGVLPSTAITYSGSASPKLSVGEASGSAGTVTLLSGGSVTSTSEAADRTFCGVFPAQSISGSFITITATTGGGSGTITYSFPSAKAFAQGTEYVANIEVSAANIGQTVSLADWTGADGTVNITAGGGSLSLDDTSANLIYDGGNGTVNVTESGTVTNITASSADNAIATASASGKVVTITPVAAGSTQVLVYGVKDGHMLSSVVNVTVAKAAASFSVPSTLSITGLGTTNTFTVNRPGTGNDGNISCEVVNESGTASATVDQGTGIVTVTGTTEGTATVKVSVGAGTNYEASTSTQDVAVTIVAVDPFASAAVGKLIGADGKLYDTAAAATSAGTTAVAVVAYMGTTTLNAETGTVSTKTNHRNITPAHGVAIALCNAKSQTWNNADVIGADGNFTNEIINAVSALKTAGKIQSDWMNLEHTSWVAIGLTSNLQSLNTPITSEMTTASDYTNMSGNYWSTSEGSNYTLGWGVYNGSWTNGNHKSYPLGIRAVFAF